MSIEKSDLRHLESKLEKRISEMHNDMREGFTALKRDDDKIWSKISSVEKEVYSHKTKTSKYMGMLAVSYAVGLPIIVAIFRHWIGK